MKDNCTMWMMLHSERDRNRKLNYTSYVLSAHLQRYQAHHYLQHSILKQPKRDLFFMHRTAVNPRPQSHTRSCICGLTSLRSPSDTPRVSAVFLWDETPGSLSPPSNAVKDSHPPAHRLGRATGQSNGRVTCIANVMEM